MAITTDMIKELRDATGVSVMQCKKALEEAGGNMEKALMILKKKSSEIAAKKSDREVHDGVVVIKKDGTKAAMLMLKCETDFVAKNSDFLALADTLVSTVLSEGIETAQTKAKEMIDPVIQKIGENIMLGDMTVVSGENVGSYIHNGKSGVLVVLSGGTETLGKDIAMHVAAMKPEYLDKTDIAAEKIALATELFQEEVNKSDKPAEIKEKMLAGKIDTYFKELTLLDQAFIKNPDQTIRALLAASGNAKIVSYVRYSLS